MCEGQYFESLDQLQQHYLDAHTVDDEPSPSELSAAEPVAAAIVDLPPVGADATMAAASAAPEQVAADDTAPEPLIDLSSPSDEPTAASFPMKR